MHFADGIFEHLLAVLFYVVETLLNRLASRRHANGIAQNLLAHPKTGFDIPLAEWFRGSLRDFLWDHVTDPRFLGRDMVAPEFLRALLEEHESGRRDNSHWLWSILVLALWFQEMEQPVACVS